MTQTINVNDFNLATTLMCGQAFRWERCADDWFMGVVGNQVWRLRQHKGSLQFDGGMPEAICHYLSLDYTLVDVIGTFPPDPPLTAAVRAHRGLRVLRQEPWETLASFIASSTKQISQIRQIVATLAERFGQPIESSWGRHYSFPSAARIAQCTERELRDCKLGFRAPHLLGAATAVTREELRLSELSEVDLETAVQRLCTLRGVGDKIARCTLLFSCGHNASFPIDVWIERALRRIYFSGQTVTAHALRAFTLEHFGPFAGWAQQYLFHGERDRGTTRLLANH